MAKKPSNSQPLTTAQRLGSLIKSARDIIIHFNATEEMHTLGRLYESMLKEMRDAAGDSGEFYTPRPVVRFMVEVIDRRLGETVLDPAWGTGGFLVEAYQHLEKQCRTVQDHKLLQTKSLLGGEAKPLPYLLAQMNLLLHGLESPRISPENSLNVRLAKIGDRDRVDIIPDQSPLRRRGGARHPRQLPRRQADRRNRAALARHMPRQVDLLESHRHEHTATKTAAQGCTPAGRAGGMGRQHGWIRCQNLAKGARLSRQNSAARSARRVGGERTRPMNNAEWPRAFLQLASTLATALLSARRETPTVPSLHPEIRRLRLPRQARADRQALRGWHALPDLLRLRRPLDHIYKQFLAKGGPPLRPAAEHRAIPASCRLVGHFLVGRIALDMGRGRGFNWVSLDERGIIMPTAG